MMQTGDLNLTYTCLCLLSHIFLPIKTLYRNDIDLSIIKTNMYITYHSIFQVVLLLFL